MTATNHPHIEQLSFCIPDHSGKRVITAAMCIKGQINGLWSNVPP